MNHADPFQSTLQKSYSWLNELEDEMNLESRHRAYTYLRAVLHVLRDQLSVAEATDLSAQLPMLIRGIYFEGWTPGKQKHHSRSQHDFLSRVQELFKPNDEDPYEVCQAVFKVLERNIEMGEITHVKQQLSKPIKYLWPSHITILL